MSDKYIVKTRTSQIQILKDVLGMLEGLSSGEIYLMFKKDEDKEKEMKNIDTDSDDNSDDNSDYELSKKKDKKKSKKKKLLLSSDSDSDSDDDYSKKKKKIIDNSKGGITIKTLSSNQTIISLIKLRTSMFSEFYVKDPEFSFWIDVKELNKFIKGMETDNRILTMFITKDEEKSLKFKLTHTEKKKSYKSYEQGFNEPDTEIDSIPGITFDMSVAISSSLFKKICNDMKKFSESMSIKCDANQIIFSCINEKYKKPYTDSYENGDEVKIIVNQNKKKEVRSSYYLEDLSKIKYPSNICDDIILHLASKSPLIIHSNIGDDHQENVEHGRILIYLSPYDNKLEDDDYYDKTKDCYKDKKPIMKN